MSDEVLSLV